MRHIFDSVQGVETALPAAVLAISDRPASPSLAAVTSPGGGMFDGPRVTSRQLETLCDNMKNAVHQLHLTTGVQLNSVILHPCTVLQRQKSPYSSCCDLTILDCGLPGELPKVAAGEWVNCFGVMDPGLALVEQNLVCLPCVHCLDTRHPRVCAVQQMSTNLDNLDG